MESASYNHAKKAWILRVVRNGERLKISTKHFVLAVGPGGTIPKMPKFANRVGLSLALLPLSWLTSFTGRLQGRSDAFGPVQEL